MKILIYGIGNPGRQDDGVGALLVEKLERTIGTFVSVDGTEGGSGRRDAPPAVHEVSYDANYQLNVEDADAISSRDVVIFADADAGTLGETGGPDAPFRLYRLNPEPSASFSTHSVSAGGVLALCHELYNAHPAAFMLGIRGYEWEFNAPMSRAAKSNVDAALQFLVRELSRSDPLGSA